jgi:uncharacterized protein YacL
MRTGTTQFGAFSELNGRISSVVMLLLRFVFVLAVAAVGWNIASSESGAESPFGGHKDLIIIGFLGVALIVIAIDVLIPRKSLSAISGLFFGLIVGLVVAYGLSLIIDMFTQSTNPDAPVDKATIALISNIKIAVGVICCYLAVSFILQTKDDVRFVIPYVEFSKETKGARPFVLDTSVIVDGRIADIAETKVIERLRIATTSSSAFAGDAAWTC